MTRTEEEKKRDLKSYLERKVKSAKEEIENFKKILTENPSYALEWGDKIFTYAEEIRLYGHLLSKFDEVTIESIKGYLTKEILLNSQYKESSTSMCSNLVQRTSLAVKAYLLAHLDII